MNATLCLAASEGLTLESPAEVRALVPPISKMGRLRLRCFATPPRLSVLCSDMGSSSVLVGATVCVGGWCWLVRALQWAFYGSVHLQKNVF